MRTKYLFFLLSFLLSKAMMAQDYFVIIKKNDQITYNYPQNVTMNLYDEEGNVRTISEDDALDVSGNYTLKIDVPWKNEPEIIESDGGRLEIFKLTTDIRDRRYLTKIDDNLDKSEHMHQNDQPRLIRKELFKSEVNIGEYNLLLTFNNNLVVRLFDGEGRAWLNNEEIKVENHYLVQTDRALLKLSFDAETGETWWVWEQN